MKLYPRQKAQYYNAGRFFGFLCIIDREKQMKYFWIFPMLLKFVLGCLPSLRYRWCWPQWLFCLTVLPRWLKVWSEYFLPMHLWRRAGFLMGLLNKRHSHHQAVEQCCWSDTWSFWINGWSIRIHPSLWFLSWPRRMLLVYISMVSDALIIVSLLRFEEVASEGINIEFLFDFDRNLTSFFQSGFLKFMNKTG